MSPNNPFEAFAGARYINLETVRKNGAVVRTPVWFAASPDEPGKLYTYTMASAGKVKRIRNNSQVRIAPCDLRGNLRGDWIPARAEIASPESAARCSRLLNRKYFPVRLLMNFFALISGSKRAGIIIRPA
ncbi:MAG: PPOX class F420-dependent oxidoreductase [Acidobacteriia bacterium]|nr:PPOX class F420-dependent oxidoreductase [Terriglobia bacterium]